MRKYVPVILMIWPYFSALLVVLPDKERTVSGFLITYSILTVIVYSLNIWNAFTQPCGDFVRRLAFWDMLIKLGHIPFYLGGFMAGALLVLVMVVPAFIFVSPILISFIVVIELGLMLTSSMYGISAVIRLLRKNAISKKSALLHIILHLIFVTDLISAIYLYRKIKKKELPYRG